MNISDTQFLGTLSVWRSGQVGLPRVQRWSKYQKDSPGIRSQDSLQHSYSLTLLGRMILSQLRDKPPFDESLFLTALMIHDHGEGEIGTDTLYIDKSLNGDLDEYNAFEARFSTLDGLRYKEFQRAFLLQFALKNPPCFPEEARRVMEALAVAYPRECYLFDATERFDYFLFAYEQFHELGNGKILVQTLRHQLSHLNRLVEVTLPEFGAIWTPEIRERSEAFVACHAGKWIEKKGER